MPRSTVPSCLVPFALLAALPAQLTPDSAALTQAREWMKQTGKPVLALVAPGELAQIGGRLTAAQEKALLASLRERLAVIRTGTRGGGGKMTDEYLATLLPLGEAAARFTSLLHLRLLSRDPGMMQVLLEARLGVFDAAEIGAKKGENLVLLDRDGRRQDGATADLLDEAAFLAASRSLLHGGGRLEERVAKARTKEVVAELRELRSADREAQARALASLLARYDEVEPVIAQEVAAARGPFREVLAKLIAARIDQTAGTGRDSLLPFGARWAFTGPEVDPCPPCGMAIVTAASNRMLTLWQQ